MAGNHDRSASRKEQEVKEQQRKLAALLGNRRNSASSGVSSSASTQSSSSEPRYAAPSARNKDASRNPAATSSTASLKRPRPSSASAVLAAARARAAGTRTTPNDSSQKSVDTSKLKDKDDSMRLQRKRKAPPTGESTSKLANLVQNASSMTKKSEDDDLVLGGPVASPNDFWKRLREWDFVTDLAAYSSDDVQEPPRKALPDTFISVKHYISQWAPLCLAETRAQLLSELMSDVGPPGRSRMTCVGVETTTKGGRRPRGPAQFATYEFMDMESCHVEIKPKQGETSGSPSTIYANDIYCLVPAQHKDMVEMLLRGKKLQSYVDSFKRFGIIGHTEVQRKDINGLILKVSKRRWAQVGTKTMYLLRVGGNVTALREFTALCGVETLPLKRYLLGHHLEGIKKASQGREEHMRKEDLLKKMGGVDALGKGFTEYASHKFNASQLKAISASAHGYGEGGITLIKGPPGTGKTTTLVAVLNSLHIRQYNKYYAEVKRIASMRSGNRQGALETARGAKPRLLVCAPSNAAIDNIILKIFEDGFVDGSGKRYNPNMIRVGVGQSNTVSSVSLETKVNQILSDMDYGQLDASVAGFKFELQRITTEIAKLRRKCHEMTSASPWPLGKDWEIRIDDEQMRAFFVNHKDQTTTYECPPPPEPGETQFDAQSMPEYRAYMGRIVKSVESYFSVKTNLERSMIVKASLDNGTRHFELKQSLENHLLNSVHLVMTTLGTAGNRVFEGVDRFEVVVVDEAAQSVEPATLSALTLGSRRCVLVGDPQQLPATIFNVSGRHSKYDRSLFQRLEEAGQPVHMLNQQYRMHPKISHFPRHVFYKGTLLDGPNVTHPSYGQALISSVQSRVPTFQPFTILDLDSKEERGGTSLSNSTEAALAVQLHSILTNITNGLILKSRVAVITPYSQQVRTLRNCFRDKLGQAYERHVEINTVDAFQGREANVVIFSAVRAAGSHGVGFLSDVRRMNVALTRAKHLLFVIARCQSISVNPYWKDLVQHATASNAVVTVPLLPFQSNGTQNFADVSTWRLASSSTASTTSSSVSIQSERPADPRKRRKLN